MKEDSNIYLTLKNICLNLPVVADISKNKPYIQNTEKITVGNTIEIIDNKKFVRALKNISVDFQFGTRIAILGANGSGKTSLLRVLSGIYKPSTGKRKVKGKISALFSSSIGLNMHGTGIENTRYACALYGFDYKETDAIINNVRDFSELGDYMDLPIRTYSRGMKTRLGFSIITSVRPDILIIDEVLSAGDFAFSKKISKKMHEVLQRAKILVFASHSAELMKMFCEEALWISKGEIKLAGDFKTVWDAYKKQTE